MDVLSGAPKDLGALMWRTAVRLLAEQEETELKYELIRKKDGVGRPDRKDEDAGDTGDAGDRIKL